MPVYRGSNDKITFYKWGTRGKKYSYTPGNPKQRYQAKKKAIKQGIAIKIRMKKK